MPSPCDECNEEECWDYCPRCFAKGYVLTLTVGVGQHSLVPCYVQTVCPQCQGEGKLYCEYWS